MRSSTVLSTVLDCSLTRDCSFRVGQHRSVGHFEFLTPRWLNSYQIQHMMSDATPQHAPTIFIGSNLVVSQSLENRVCHACRAFQKWKGVWHLPGVKVIQCPVHFSGAILPSIVPQHGIKGLTFWAVTWRMRHNLMACSLFKG